MGPVGNTKESSLLFVREKFIARNYLQSFDFIILQKVQIQMNIYHK